VADTKPFYVRMPVALKEQVSEFAAQRGLSLSDAICSFVEKGLEYDGLKISLNECAKENQTYKLKNVNLEGQVTTLKGQLFAVQNALRGLRSLIQTRVARCKSCSSEISLQDLALRRCPQCGGSSMDLLEEYRGQMTAGQAIERMLAIVGGIFLASQLLGNGDSD
jgi:Zn finger protein HypA/HybF involved in hydrogenase expression